MSKPLIKITGQKSGDDSWAFKVGIEDEKGSESSYTVKMSREYYKKVTHSNSLGQANEKISPEELVRRSFEFLLEREPKESILSEFDLSVIQTYFPEYENYIKNIL